MAKPAAQYVSDASQCQCCGKRNSVKDHQHLVYRTLFGKIRLASHRFYTNCQCGYRTHTGKSHSPLATLLKERIHPDLLMVESQLAAWLSFRHASILLQSLMPLEDAIAVSLLKANTLKIGQRLVAEWETQVQKSLHDQPGPCWTSLVWGGDGARTFTVEGPMSCHAYVASQVTFASHRMQVFLNQNQIGEDVPLAVFSDAGNDVQDAAFILNRPIKRVSDWFHIAMRFEHVLQALRGLPQMNVDKTALLEEAEHCKWLLWLGKSDDAINRLNVIEQTCMFGELTKPFKSLVRLIRYLQNHQSQLIH